MRRRQREPLWRVQHARRAARRPVRRGRYRPLLRTGVHGLQRRPEPVDSRTPGSNATTGTPTAATAALGTACSKT